jgi:hypothetical protein
VKTRRSTPRNTNILTAVFCDSPGGQADVDPGTLENIPGPSWDYGDRARLKSGPGAPSPDTVLSAVTVIQSYGNRAVLPSPPKALAAGVKVRVFAAHSRRVAPTEAKVLFVPALLIRQRLCIEFRVRLIVRSAKIPIIRRDGL